MIPWWNGTRKVTGLELREGVACVRELISLLPKLHAVVLVGGKAAKARVYLEDAGLAVFTSAHPSPLVKARFPDRWNAIPEEWGKVLKFLNNTLSE
jgi:uracil DNA glycosylase